MARKPKPSLSRPQPEVRVHEFHARWVVDGVLAVAVQVPEVVERDTEAFEDGLTTLLLFPLAQAVDALQPRGTVMVCHGVSGCVKVCLGATGFIRV